ncbi:MAG: mucoidy inhibitor MuiA family protein [Pseudomonadota bacterium]
MKRILFATLLASAVSPTALAATFEPDSKIDVVTVYPSGAQVTRTSTLDISAGEHIIIIDDLPAQIDPASVRVTGTANGAMAIGGVDVRIEVLESGGSDADRNRFETRLEELDDLVRSLNQQQADIQVRRELLQSLVRTSRPASSEAVFSAISLSETLSIVADEMSSLNKQATETRALQRETQKEISRLRSELSLLAPKREQRTTVEIAVSAAVDISADFDIKYNVRDASWRAIYDANLSLQDGVEDIDIGIKRRALVQQATQESWDDVALILSTARPTSATNAPELYANVLNIKQPIAVQAERTTRLRQMSSDAEFMTLDASPNAMSGAQAAPELEAAAEKVAAMNTGGFNASFEIADRVTVANTREAKSVLLGVDSWSVDVSALSVPRIDPTAYLMAAFELGGEATYLPGEVLLNRDGTYIGRGQMPLLAPGETHQLGFGNDDYVSVERVESDRKVGETGILVSSNVERRIAEINIINNHDFAMPVRIIDRMPVSDHEDIEVQALRDNTIPSETDVDGQRGVIAFDYDMAAGAERQINIGYEVSWPSEMLISQVQ